jgi:hypothetical protein
MVLLGRVARSRPYLRSGVLRARQGRRVPRRRATPTRARPERRSARRRPRPQRGRSGPRRRALVRWTSTFAMSHVPRRDAGQRGRRRCPRCARRRAAGDSDRCSRTRWPGTPDVLVPRPRRQPATTCRGRLRGDVSGASHLTDASVGSRVVSSRETNASAAATGGVRDGIRYARTRYLVMTAFAFAGSGP